jgi:hypothetical protein
MVEFKQKRGFQLRSFKLYDDKIVIETKTLRKNHKYELKLDRLGSEILYESDSTIVGKIVFYICLAIPLVLLIIKFCGQNIENAVIGVNFLLWYLLALINYLKQHQDDIIIIGGQNNLSFFRNIPNEAKVIEFINLVILKSKNYLKSRYAKIDTDIPEETFISRLTWLRDKEIITEREFYKLKEEYNYKKMI